MRLTEKHKKALRDAFFMAGSGYKQRVQLTKTTHATIEMDASDNVMNPAIVVRMYKNNKFQKRYYEYSLVEFMATIKRHK